MVTKCECCRYKDDERYMFTNGETSSHCTYFVPDIDLIKKFAFENNITVLETIALIQLSCK